MSMNWQKEIHKSNSTQVPRRVLLLWYLLVGMGITYRHTGVFGTSVVEPSANGGIAPGLHGKAMETRGVMGVGR